MKTKFTSIILTDLVNLVTAVVLKNGIQGSILSMFYEQLLGAMIPKVQKDSQVVSLFLRLLDLCAQKLLIEC
jgi:hypothetical protein